MGTTHKHRGICWLLSGVLFLATSLATIAAADMVQMSNGTAREDLWIESIDIRPDGVRVIANRLSEGKLSARSERFAGSDFASIAFQLPNDIHPGRGARVTTPEGVVTDDLIIEFAEWGAGGFVFRCRRPNTPPDGETFQATSEHARLIEFAPAPFTLRTDAQPIARGIIIPDRSSPAPVAATPPDDGTESSPAAARPLWLVFLAGVAFTLFVVITLIGAGLLAWLVAIRRR